MAPSLQMYVVLSALSFKFVSACKEGKFSAFLNCYFSSIIPFSLRFFWQLKLSILCFDFNTCLKKKFLCQHHDVCVVKAILMCFGL